jgi:Trp operon repressor
MPRKSDKENRNQKLRQMAELLKFVLTLDDDEIVKSTIESVVELLEEEINK